MTPQELLDLPLGPNPAQAATIRDYLKALLTELWREADGFSGKRPFGFSTWQYEIYEPMIAAGAVPGITLDEYHDPAQPYAEWSQARAQADELILEAIKAL